MTIIKCEASWCDKNEDGECTNNTIVLSYDPYDAFWCKSNIRYGLTQEERYGMTYAQLRKAELEWEKTQEELKNDK